MMMGFGLVIPLLLIGAVAYALGLRPQSNLTSLAQNSQNPLEVLNVRYVCGEITREEYEQVRRDLES